LKLVEPLRQSGLEGVYDEEQIEAYVMGCARRGELNIKVDHSDESITFVDDAFIAPEDSSTVWLSKEGTIQPSTAQFVRTRLNKIATCLHVSINTVFSSPEEEKERQGEKLTALVAAAEAERKALQVRRALVARRRELLSELSVRKEKEEASRRAEISRREKEEEEKRLKDELRKKELERARKEIESIKVREAEKLAASLRGKLGDAIDVRV
jgi:translation initiation factor 3 subunit A